MTSSYDFGGLKSVSILAYIFYLSMSRWGLYVCYNILMVPNVILFLIGLIDILVGYYLVIYRKTKTFSLVKKRVSTHEENIEE